MFRGTRGVGRHGGGPENPGRGDPAVRETVLYQGSLQLPEARRQAAELETALARALAAARELRWVLRGASAEMQAAAAELEAKYRSADWIRRR